MILSQQKIKNKIIIYFPPATNIQSDNAEMFKTVLKSHLQINHYKLILNCENLNFIDSSGISALVSCLKVALLNNGWLKIIYLPQAIQHIFEIIKLHKIIPVYDTLEHALED